MRKSLAFLPLSLVLAVAVCAQQHAAAPATPSAPARMMAPMPAPIHAAPALVMHAAPVHQSVAAHPISRTPISGVTPVVPHRRKPTSPSNPTVGSTGHSGHGYPVVSRCNQHFSYPIQGLNACPPPVTPVYGGAYIIPAPYYYGDSGVQDQELPQSNEEQVAEEQPADNQQEGADNNNQQESDLDRQPVPEEHARAGSSTLNDSLAEFVFVERDGSKLYAVAYSFLDNRLHYVTKDGIRHTVTLDSLDLGTTQKLNEQLGNTINLPSLPPSGDALNISPAPLR